jgi:hypothetical protein
VKTNVIDVQKAFFSWFFNLKTVKNFPLIQLVNFYIVYITVKVM